VNGLPDTTCNTYIHRLIRNNYPGIYLATDVGKMPKNGTMSLLSGISLWTVVVVTAVVVHVIAVILDYMDTTKPLDYIRN